MHTLTIPFTYLYARNTMQLQYTYFSERQIQVKPLHANKGYKAISSVTLWTCYSTEANTPPLHTPTGMISSHHRPLPHKVPTTLPTYYNNNNLIFIS